MRRAVVFVVFAAALSAVSEARILDIEVYGAVPFSKAHAKLNGQALIAALQKAKPTETVLIPEGKSYYLMPQAPLKSPARDITFQLDGSIILSDAIAEWPLDPDSAGGKYLPFLKVTDATGFRMVGNGVIDGSGHRWWWTFAVGLLPDIKRPFTFDFEFCTDLAIEDVTILDSPRFNVYIEKSHKVRVNRVKIIDDWRAQLATQEVVSEYRRLRKDEHDDSWKAKLPTEQWWMDYRQLTDLLLRLPMFPFNTDGVDISGTDIIVKDCIISNFDDVVVAKPSNRPHRFMGLPPTKAEDFTWCTGDMLIQNLTGLYGGGASVGSVHPTNQFPCVDGVRFEDVTLWAPLKGVYVKPDHGICENERTCRCLIANIQYENITLKQGQKPPWWDDFESDARAKVLFVKPDTENELYDLLTFKAAQFKAFAEQIAVPPHVTLSTGDERTFGSFLEKYKIWKAKRAHEPFDCRWWNYLCMVWPIWLGTQQQLEPDGKGSGIWPTTDPRAIVANVSLVNVSARGGTWPEAAAAIRFNASSPATGVHLENVVIDADRFLRDQLWICDDPDSAYGDTAGVLTPAADKCLVTDAQGPALLEKKAAVPI